MSTRDQFTFGQMSYPSSYTSPQYISGYPPVVDNGSIGACDQSYDFLYEQPPPAPLLEAEPAVSPSPSPSASKYRSIRPRPNEYGPDTENPDDTLRLKPRKRQRSEIRRKIQRLPQERSGESKAAEHEGGAGMVLSARPEVESSAPFGQDTDSHLCPSTQEHFSAPRPISPSNGLTTPLLPNNAPESLVPSRSPYHHDVQPSLFSPENPFPCRSASIEQDHRQNSMEAAFIGFAAHLEKAQVLQSLSIVQDYMAKHPSIFERQAPETVQRWMVDIQREDLSVSLPE